MRALVTGSTGYIGSRLVPVLLAAGWQVLAGARDPAKLEAFDTTAGVTSAGGHTESVPRASSTTAGAVAVSLDVTDEDSCAAAFAGHGRVDVAYYLVHALGEGDFSTSDLHAARIFAAAAAAAGVGRIVYLGGLIPDGEHLSAHLASRKAVAEALGAAPPESREGRSATPAHESASPGSAVELVWLRAAIILGAGSTSYELIRHLVDRLPLIPTPRWMGHRVQPIAVDDVLHYLLAAATAAVPAGGYDIGGPTALPYRDLVALQARVSGRRRLLVPVVGVSTAVAAQVISVVVPLPRELVLDLVDSLNNTMVAHDDSITALVPPPEGGLTGLEEALRRCASSPADGPDLHGIAGTVDPLHRTITDPDWAA